MPDESGRPCDDLSPSGLAVPRVPGTRGTVPITPIPLTPVRRVVLGSVGRGQAEGRKLCGVKRRALGTPKPGQVGPCLGM